MKIANHVFLPFSFLGLVALLAATELSACCRGSERLDGGIDGGLGAAECIAAGGHCIVGPPANCQGTLLTAYDCNPPPRNPAGAVCCLPPPDAGPPPFCSIASVQVSNRASNPANPSLCCNTSRNSSGWSPRFVQDDGLSIPGATVLAAADFDNDGWLDLAVVDGVGPPYPSAVAVSLNKQGVLVPSGTYPVAAEAIFATAIDLNGDGFLDLVVETFIANTGDLSVLINKGDGTFYPATNYPSDDVGPGGVKSGHFGLPVAPGIVSGNAGLTFYGVIADGGLLAPLILDMHTSPILALQDFNSDGLLDIAEAQFRGGPVTVYLGTADGGFQASGSYGDAGPLVSNVLAGDLDGDGIVDLAVANGTGIASVSQIAGSVGLLFGQGDGGFGTWNVFPAPGTVLGLALADLDGDGSNELLFTSADAGYRASFSLFQLSFADGGSMFPMLSRDGGVDFVLVGDFNNDHAQDIAAQGSDGMSVYLNGCP
jgi:hypothetical protein